VNAVKHVKTAYSKDALAPRTKRCRNKQPRGFSLAGGD
jgi:hypothetical protein